MSPRKHISLEKLKNPLARKLPKLKLDYLLGIQDFVSSWIFHKCKEFLFVKTKNE